MLMEPAETVPDVVVTVSQILVRQLWSVELFCHQMTCRWFFGDIFEASPCGSYSFTGK